MKIRWRLILWLGLTWYLVVSGPGWAEWVWSAPCNYLHVETCEP